MGLEVDPAAVTNTLADLVAIPSVNPKLHGGPGEGPIGEYVARFLAERGLRTELQEVEPGRRNVLGWLEGTLGDRVLLFEAHMDTVPPVAGQVDPFVPREAGGRLYGRGACDTKASLAAMLHALAAVKASGARPHHTLCLAATVGEELAHQGARHLVDSGFRPAAAVVGEPTKLEVVIAHRGAVRFSITTKGRAAHSSNPADGLNAIVQMADVIRALDRRLAPQLRERRPPLVGPATLSVGTIHGGLQSNVVPDRCRIEVDRRLNPGETPHAAVAEVEALLRELQAEDPTLEWQVDVGAYAPVPMETSPDAKIVEVARRTVEAALGRAVIGGVPYGTDASPLSAAGVPCVVLGPGDVTYAHSIDEHVDLVQVAQAAEIFATMMRAD